MSRSESRSAAPDPALIFAALGDGTRLALLRTLSGGEARSIASLSADTSITRQAVTKHLKVLERAGLVSNIRIGRESRYAYRPEAVLEARDFLNAVSQHWDDALGRLRSFVER